MDSGFGDDVGVKAVAKVDRVDVIAGEKKKKREKCQLVFCNMRGPKAVAWNMTGKTHHSRSLYIIVKNTWRKRLTALINTDKR